MAGRTDERLNPPPEPAETRSIQVTLLLSTTLTAALGVARGQRVAAAAKDRNVNDEKVSRRRYHPRVSSHVHARRA